MRIVVIGSEGVIGKPLVKRLESDSHKVLAVDIIKQARSNYMMADIVYSESLRPVFEFSPDIVFHLAGEVSRETCEIWPTKAIETNLIGTQNVISLCVEYSSRLVFTSTSEACGDLCKAGLSISEDMEPESHQGIYGLSKWFCEKLIEHEIEKNQLDAVILRYFMSYGNELPSSYRSALSRWIVAALLDKPIEVHANTIRQWTYIDDTVDGTIRVGLSKRQGIYHIGTEDSISSVDVVNKIIKLTGSKSQVNVKDCPVGIYPFKIGDFTKMKKDFGWKAKVELDDGLKRAIDYMREHLHEYDTSQSF